MIDIQEKLLPPIFQKEQLVRNAQLLIRAAAILKIPALVSTQYAKGLGGTVPEISSLLSRTEADRQDVVLLLRQRRILRRVKRLPGHRNTLLLCGMESHICVTQTAWRAARRISRPRCVRCGQFAHRMELEDRLDRMRAAGCRDFVDGNDDLRVDAVVFVGGFQRIIAALEGLASRKKKQQPMISFVNLRALSGK